MPLYEYQCQKCRHRFEKIQKYSDPEEKVCPKCGAEVEKLLSAPAVQFKGTGWYATDYPKQGSSKSSSESSNRDGGSASDDSSASSAKPKESSSGSGGNSTGSDGKSSDAKGQSSSSEGKSSSGSKDSGN